MKPILFLKKINYYAYEIIFILSIIFILIFGIYRLISGESGSWSDYYFYLNPKKEDKNTKKVSRVSKGEKECRRVLENYFGKPFPNCRPNFMNNEVTNFNLELDCFCPSLNIGCEYNGVQHYKYTPYFHKNKEAFRNQQYRDYMKRELCKKNGIKLIEVPYNIKEQDIEKFILGEIKKLTNY